jgi:hypothetical protein
MDCQEVRTELHIEPTNAVIQTHLQACSRCARYADRMARLDGVLGAELVVTAPAVVTAALQTVATEAALPYDSLDRALREELVLPVPAELTLRLQALVAEPARGSSPLDAVLRDSLVLQAPPELTARLQALVPETPIAAPVPAMPVVSAPRRWVVATVYFVTATLLMLSLMYAGQIYSLMLAQLGLNEWLSQIAGWPAEVLNQFYAVVPQARVVVGMLVRLQQPLQWLLVALVLWAVIDMSQHQGQRDRQYA